MSSCPFGPTVIAPIGCSARAADLAGARDHHLGDGARVVHRARVGHRADVGEAAGRGRGETGQDVLFVLLPRLAQVRVQIDESGQKPAPVTSDGSALRRRMSSAAAPRPTRVITPRSTTTSTTSSRPFAGSTARTAEKTRRSGVSRFMGEARPEYHSSSGEGIAPCRKSQAALLHARRAPRSTMIASGSRSFSSRSAPTAETTSRRASSRLPGQAPCADLGGPNCVRRRVPPLADLASNLFEVLHDPRGIAVALHSSVLDVSFRKNPLLIREGISQARLPNGASPKTLRGTDVQRPCFLIRLMTASQAEHRRPSARRSLQRQGEFAHIEPSSPCVAVAAEPEPSEVRAGRAESLAQLDPGEVVPLGLGSEGVQR